MIKIKKGLDIPISGQPKQSIDECLVNRVALLGRDYLGLRPSLQIEVGERVKRGQLLFTDKHKPGVSFTAPAGGTISSINRGERRALLSVVIDVDQSDEPQLVFDRYPASQLEQLPAQQVRQNLLSSGLWSSFRTRPFSKIPAADSSPAAIFVTAMDSNPLAANPEVVIKGYESNFCHGLTLLSKLTKGKVFLCKQAGSKIPLSGNGRIEVEEFSGPHPAGLVGTHIHFLLPVDKQRTVWSINYQDVIAIGHLFTTGELRTERVVALAGPQVRDPRLLRTRMGADISQLVAGELNAGELRIISGSPLHGDDASGAEAYLGRYHQQVSVLSEGRQQQLLGWAMPGTNKFSVLNLFLSRLLPNKPLPLTTSTGGRPRAMVPIGAYEKVMPLDMLATPLLRALIVKDSDSAQQLGCLELDEEDLALCTFVCPGKYDYGPLLREMLSQIEREG